MESNLKLAIKECNVTCKDLSNLLENENVELSKRNIKVVEKNIKEKRALTLKLEEFVNTIKTNITAIQQSAECMRDLNVFKRLIDGYKGLVERNAMLLKAAYTATSTILQSIQKKKNPVVVKTYNAYGQIQESSERAPSLLNYSV